MSELEFQTWICPKCHDDHFMGKSCIPKDDSPFMPHESDKSHIAEKYRDLKAKYEKCVSALNDAIEYLEPRLTNKFGSRGLTILLPKLKETIAELGEK